jgi:S1-C subfamily serine protease
MRIGFRGTVLLATALLALAAPAISQNALSALDTDVDQVTKKARASVVTVFAQRTTTVRGAAKPRLYTRVGSGVAVEDDVILTTASVVLGAERLLVRTMNGTQVDASLIGMDPVFNVALLRVPELHLPPLPFATGRAPQAGDWIIALGTSYRAQPTQSVGYVAFRFPEPRIPLLQLTNTVYPGNSGGAALNPRGELVGIVQGELASPEASVNSGGERRPGGMSFVLPVETVRPVYLSLRRDGRVRHGYLGVSTTAASVMSDTEQGLEVPIGARIESIASGGPASLLVQRLTAFAHLFGSALPLPIAQFVPDWLTLGFGGVAFLLSIRRLWQTTVLRAIVTPASLAVWPFRLLVLALVSFLLCAASIAVAQATGRSELVPIGFILGWPAAMLLAPVVTYVEFRDVWHHSQSLDVKRH